VLENAGRLKRVPFTERDAMNRAVAPVMAAYAKEIDADGIMTQINALTS
jgi:TRAP-type transport system periplasmic protein